MSQESPSSPPRRPFPWIRAGFFFACVGAVAFMFSPARSAAIAEAKSLVREYRRVDSGDTASQPSAEPVPAVLPVSDPPRPEPTPRRTSPPPRPQTAAELSGGDISKMRNGITYASDVSFSQGGQAVTERVDQEAYKANFRLEVRLPEAASTLEQLEAATPGLGEILPGLADLLENAAISPYYAQLYENKAKRVRQSSEQLRKLLSRHNFYDCNTILHLRNRSNNRRALLLQADMDVVSDGSDGDRLPVMPDEIVNSTHYQPYTSYGWRKRSSVPNPMIAGFKRRIANADRELADPDTKSDRADWLRGRKKMLERGIEDMEARSYLIAEYDPFIVLPISIFKSEGPYASKPGDYAVVIHDGVIYPTIVGDGGPTFKVGEASLRMARQINERASPYSRPVSDLSVTYLVFPGSRSGFEPPDYDDWRSKCGELLNELTGLGQGYELFEWEDTLPAQ